MNKKTKKEFEDSLAEIKQRIEVLEFINRSNQGQIYDVNYSKYDCRHVYIKFLSADNTKIIRSFLFLGSGHYYVNPNGKFLEVVNGLSGDITCVYTVEHDYLCLAPMELYTAYLKSKNIKPGDDEKTEEKSEDSVSSTKVAYVCDRKQCENCSGECRHTFDIKHAKNFFLNGDVYEEYLNEEDA